MSKATLQVGPLLCPRYLKDWFKFQTQKYKTADENLLLFVNGHTGLAMLI